MGTVGRAEGVVHVEVCVAGELPRESGIVRHFPGLEAGVFEETDPLVVQERPELRLDRLQRVRGVRTFRPAEMRAENDFRSTLLEQVQDRRESSPDARVVGNAPVLERYVEVDSDEDTLALHVRFPHGTGPPQSRRCTRSTIRQLNPHSFSTGKPMVPPCTPSFKATSGLGRPSGN